MKGRPRRGHSALIIGRCPLYARPQTFIGGAVLSTFMSLFAKHDVRKSVVVIVSVSI